LVLPKLSKRLVARQLLSYRVSGSLTSSMTGSGCICRIGHSLSAADVYGRQLSCSVEFPKARCWARSCSYCTSPTWLHWFRSTACHRISMLMTLRSTARVLQLTSINSHQQCLSASTTLLAGCGPIGCS